MTFVWRVSARAESRQREGEVAMTRERDNGDPSTFRYRSGRLTHRVLLHRLFAAQHQRVSRARGRVWRAAGAPS
jgi:hypothetical protein